MADLQPRRYITRARAQAGVAAPATSSSSGNQNTKTTASAKRKALTESTLALENTRSKTDIKPALPSALPPPAAQPALTTRTTRTATAKAAAAAIRKPAIRPKATVSSLQSVPPRRSERTVAPVKKVTFAASENKENDVPTKAPIESEAPSNSDDKETDVLMSTSMGALSVKPKRIPRTKLQQPSTGIYADSVPALPALSPQKVRRPKRVCIPEKDDMEDELLCPTSPRLAEKPRRPLPSLGKKSAIDGAGLLIPNKDSQKDSQKSSVLFGSPARRFPQSPTKPKDAASSSAPQPSPSKLTGLSSPARRPQGTGLKLGMPISKSGVKGSSLKFSITDLSDLSSDPFSDNNDKPRADDSDDVFNSRPIIQRKMVVKREPSVDTSKQGPSGSNARKDILTFNKRERSAASADMTPAELVADGKSDVDCGAVVSGGSTTPPSSTKAIVGRVGSPSRLPKLQISVNMEEDVSCDADGDISMADAENTPSTPPPAQPIKKHRSPREGGSSFGLFDLGEDDEDDELDFDSENVPPQVAAGSGNRVENMELDKPVAKDNTRGFGQEITCVNPGDLEYVSWGNVPVDPMLLGEDISDVVIDYADPAPIKVPVKFHDDDEDVFADNNHYALSADAFTYNQPRIDEEAYHRRQCNEERSGNVLAGAVVFVDAYTNDGADCGETFRKMLKGMGAKVLEGWDWSPDAPSKGKVGITHVVFKDGSPKTLQKVKAAKGLVSCVVLRWVIECAQLEEWLDETDYAIDLDDTPRENRRSREPNMDAVLSKINDTQPLKTPKRIQHSQFVPKTGPPKFDLTSASPALLERIRIARRQTLQFAPKVGSPLVRSWRAPEH